MKERDRMTRKMMAMNRALQLRNCICRLYLPRKRGGRGLIGVEDYVDLAILGLEDYIRQSVERLIVGG